MLDDWGKGILKANRIDEDNVESITGDMVVTFKDGTQKTICENWTRELP